MTKHGCCPGSGCCPELWDGMHSWSRCHLDGGSLSLVEGCWWQCLVPAITVVPSFLPPKGCREPPASGAAQDREGERAVIRGRVGHADTRFSPKELCEVTSTWAEALPVGKRHSELSPSPVLFVQLFLQLLEVEEMQRKMSLAPQEQQPCCQEQKSQEVERIYQALKIKACSSEE